MSWFEEWFESSLYEQIYADRDETEAVQLVDWLREILPPADYPEILDLGCGRGRHAINMAEKGYTVKGIDLSESAIEKARQSAKERKLENITFQVGDMRETLPYTFDAVVNLFTTFGYFETDRENEKIIANVSAMLRSEGYFLLDYFNSRRVRKHYNPYEEGSIEGISYKVKRYIEDGAIYKQIRFDEKKLEGKSSYKERVKLYEMSWFRSQMEKHRLNVKKVFGGYDGRSFDPDKSPRMIILAQKSSG